MQIHTHSHTHSIGLVGSKQANFEKLNGDRIVIVSEQGVSHIWFVWFKLSILDGIVKEGPYGDFVVLTTMPLPGDI